MTLSCLLAGVDRTVFALCKRGVFVAGSGPEQECGLHFATALVTLIFVGIRVTVFLSLL